MTERLVNEDGSLVIEVAMSPDGTFGITVRAPKWGDTLVTRFQEPTHFTRTLYGSVEKGE